MKNLNRFCYLLVFLTIMQLSAVEVGKNTNKINRRLILTATKNPLAKEPNTTVVSSGIVEEILLGILAEKLNFTYDLRPPSDIMSSGILLANRSWTGATGQLQRGEVDMYITATAPTPSRLLVTDVSYPVYFVDTAIMIPFPTELDNTEALYLAFQNMAWIGIGVCFVFMIIFTWLTHRITNKDMSDKSQNSLSFWFFFFISVFSSQGVNVRNTSIALRCMCGFSFLGIFIISNYYTGAYTSLLSTPKFKPVVNSIEELANSLSVKTLLVKGSSTDEYFMLTNDPTYKKIRDQMRRFPERRILDAFTVNDISTLVKDNFALIILKQTAESLIQKSYEINRSCRVTVAQKMFYSRGQCYTYPKRSNLTSIFNKQILLLQQFGLTTYADRRAASFSQNRCSISDVEAAQSSKVIRMRLKDLAGVFIVLGIGMGLSVLIFLMEVLSELLKGKRIVLSRLIFSRM